MEVIKLDPEKQKEYSIKRINNHICNHKFIEVDVELRVIRCQKCNTVVDPFDFILNMAMSVESHVSYQKRLEYEVGELQERKIRLEKDLVNLRAKIRKEK
jgi:hypothetical protein